MKIPSKNKKNNGKFFSLFGIAMLVFSISFSEDLQGFGVISSLEAKSKEKHTPQKGNINELSPKRQKKMIHYHFEVPAEIQTAVDFWKKVYTQYDRNFEIFHDTENLAVIYSILDYTDLYSDPNSTRETRLPLFQARQDAEEQRIKEVLLSIHQKKDNPSQFNAEEKRIYDLFKGDSNPNRFLEAANEKRIRSQTGVRNKFEEAIKISGAYIEEMEDIFMSYGLPVELTRMAFVESMFNVKIKSSVGASGVWQMMPDTGKRYGLSINQYIDERNDPLLATHAAARLLKNNYEMLGTWPLAINAYNSGETTMKNAVAAVGTNKIEKIIKNYRGGVYGFASRNFVPSFLAALEISNNYSKYFGKMDRYPKFEYQKRELTAATRFHDVAEQCGIDSIQLSELNPQYSESVQNNTTRIPAGYTVRIPKKSSEKTAVRD